MKTIDELGISKTPWRTGHDGMSVICGDSLEKTLDIVSFGRTPYNDRARARYKANARLIASAPDCYDALQRIVSATEGAVMDFPKWQNDLQKALDDAKKTLAKASGEEVR